MKNQWLSKLSKQKAPLSRHALMYYLQWRFAKLNLLHLFSVWHKTRYVFFHVNKAQIKIWMKEYPNGWRAVGFWIGRKCQKKGRLVIMKLGGCCQSHEERKTELITYKQQNKTKTKIAEDVDRSSILHCFAHDDLWRTNNMV